MLLRGKQKNFELCSRVNRRDKGSGMVRQEWVAEKWYSTLESAFQALLTMKLMACDAASLKELKQELENCRKELMEYYSTDFPELTTLNPAHFYGKRKKR